MDTVLITGANGIIGSILRQALAAEYEVRGVDLPDDLASYETLRRQMSGVQTVIHLAREPDSVDPTRPRNRVHPKNVEIDANVVTSVVDEGASRLILASSVHADDFRSPGGRLLTPPGSYHPATPYGVYKLISEEVGRLLAWRFGFEFTAIRMGGVTRNNSVKPGQGRTATWLSHGDLVDAFAACLRGKPVPGRSTVFYAVSDNADRVHDTANPFGWKPKDDSARLAPLSS